MNDRSLARARDRGDRVVRGPCTIGSRASLGPEPHRARRSLALAGGVLAVAAGLGAVAGASPTAPAPSVAMPGPTPTGPVEDRSELNASCVRCHAEIGRQWEASLHRHAWDDADFQHAAKREGRAFCRGCHAPESDPAVAPTPTAAAIGIACVTCHAPRDAELAPGAVLAGPGATGKSAPHAVVRTAAFHGSDACASCHEFDSPRTKSLAMQRTVSEHARSARADRSCIDCHMPAGADGRRAHGFAASRDPEMIAAALSVRAERRGADTLVLRLSPAEVGHAFPTGDLFRRLRVQAGVRTGGRFSVRDEQLLGRWFEDRLEHGLTPQRVEVRDDRPGGQDDLVTVRLKVADAGSETLHWRVVYERVDHPIGRDTPLVFGRIVAAEGHVRPRDLDPKERR